MADKVAMQTGTPEANVAVQHDPNVKIDHHGQGKIEEANLTDRDKAMIAKVDENHNKALQAEGLAPATPTPEVTQFVMPEKFQGKTAEEIAKSYVELERMKAGVPNEVPNQEANKPTLTVPTETEGTQAQAPTKEAPTEPVVSKEPEGTPKAPGEVPKATVDFDQYIGEMEDTGTLTPQSREALKAAGYPDKLIDYNLRQVNAVTELTTLKVHELSGSEDNYNTMVEWAKTGMNPVEKQDFNSKITSGDMTQVQMGITYLKSIYEAKEGTLGANSNTLLSGMPAGKVVAEPYDSWAKATKDIGSPEYQKDPSFRAKVEQRLAVSQL